MKAVLKYDLESIDDELALNRALKSTDMALVLFEIQNNLKKKCEWELEVTEGDGNKYDGLDVAMKHIFNLFEEHSIDTNNLIR
jgi:hypothetical protein